jgi:hypothetical protein
VFVGSGYRAGAFEVEAAYPRIAPNRTENHQGWRAHVVPSRRANQYVRLASGLSHKRFVTGTVDSDARVPGR